MQWFGKGSGNIDDRRGMSGGAVGGGIGIIVVILGLIFGIAGYKSTKGRLALAGIILNILLALWFLPTVLLSWLAWIGTGDFTLHFMGGI